MTTADRAPRVAIAARQIAAPAGVLFELIADPAQHSRWDGNDNVKRATDGQRVRAVGDVFTALLTTNSIRENHVIEFEEGRRIGWRPSEVGSPPPGHRWTWLLEPLGSDTTLAVHTYDWSRLDDAHRMARARRTTSDRLQASLRRLAGLAEATR